MTGAAGSNFSLTSDFSSQRLYYIIFRARAVCNYDRSEKVESRCSCPFLLALL